MLRTIPIWLLVATSFGLMSACKMPSGSNESDDEAEPETGEEFGSPDEDESPMVPADVEEPTCDPWAQDCKEGQKCVPYSTDGGLWDDHKCVPVTGDGQPGDACSYDGIMLATDSCGADSHCWDVRDVDGQWQGVCAKFCEGSGDNPICEPGSACLLSGGLDINLCVKTCNPLQQDCHAGLACFWVGYTFQCMFTAGEASSGEPCGYINDCAPGHLCTAAEALPVCDSTACCTSFCDLGEPHCADEATECSAFFQDGTAPPGYESIGICILPDA